jgi:predicted nucleic acid-binding protein
MKTAVDTSVVLDVLTADATFGAASREALRRAYDQGALVASDVVWAEIRAGFGTEDAFAEALEALGIRFEPMTDEATRLAGRVWRDSRRRGGKATAGRVMADLLVGAHASVQADVLLARDGGYFRSRFRGLRVVDPSAR